MTINELKQEIQNQKEENIRLYNIFQYRMHEDIMQPIIEQWRKGSTNIKALQNELYGIEIKERKERVANKIETTQRYITSSTYERADKRMQKQILLFMGVR